MQILTNTREKKSSPTMGVSQWTSLLMTHELRTTPSKLDCALSTLHPKHSNARGEMIRLRVSVRVRVRFRVRVRVQVGVKLGL